MLFSEIAAAHGLIEALIDIAVRSCINSRHGFEHVTEGSATDMVERLDGD